MTTYSMGYEEPFLRRLEDRSVLYEGAFFVPKLRVGMSVLDVGCGPGSITVGLARAVAPGKVVGVDFSAGQIDRARQIAAQEHLDNVDLRTGSATHLPFADATFDAVFMNALLMHLDDPARALREALRVLRPGGVVGVRDLDMRGSVDVTSDSGLPGSRQGATAFDLFAKVIVANGGNPYIGGMLRGLLHDAGFERIVMGVSPDLVADATGFETRLEHLTGIWTGPIGRRAVELGLLDDEDRHRLVQSARARAGDPRSVRLVAWFHALAQKPQG